MPRSRTVVAFTVGGLMLVAACSNDEPTTSPTPPSFTFAPTTTTTTEPPVTTAPAPDATTVPETTVPPTPPPTEATTTTTEPVAVQELILRGDGIGSARFGAAPQGVVEYVTSVLGGNTADTGWVDPFAFADCGAGGAATKARRVDWGVLSLLFSDASTYALDREHFIGYEYGRVGEIGDEPVGLHTPGNVGLGSRVVDLFAEFPEASVNEGDEDVGIPPNFYVSDVFYGLLTGTADDDFVTVIFGGYGCGE
ncbi:MAG: hypothetical protein R2697_11445 [Ilumatobacteraceae bacterium]